MTKWDSTLPNIEARNDSSRFHYKFFCTLKVGFSNDSNSSNIKHNSYFKLDKMRTAIVGNKVICEINLICKMNLQAQQIYLEFLSKKQVNANFWLSLKKTELNYKCIKDQRPCTLCRSNNSSNRNTIAIS